jgi:hypothetical protein
MIVAFLGITICGTAQKNQNLYLGIGGTFETTWSVAGNIAGDSDNFRMGVSEPAGLKVVLHHNINRFGWEWYGMIKNIRTTMVLNQLDSLDNTYYKNFKLRAHQTGGTFETGIYLGANWNVGKHQLYTALGAGVALNRFNGSSGSGSYSYHQQPDTSYLNFIGNYREIDIFYSATPLVSAMVSFRQKLKNPKLGLVYSLENKWGLTPAMTEEFEYGVELGFNNTQSTYKATFTNVRFIYLAATVAFTFDVFNKKTIADAAL